MTLYAVWETAVMRGDADGNGMRVFDLPPPVAIGIEILIVRNLRKARRTIQR